MSLCVWTLDSQRTEELLQQQSEVDDGGSYSYIDVEPCNSYLRKLTYQRLEHRYQLYLELLTVALAM